MIRLYRVFRVCAFLFFGFTIGCNDASFINRSLLADAILNDADSYFYIDTENYPAGDRMLPIGVFDSGTGGLTVLDAIVRFDGHHNGTHEATDGDGVGDFQEESFIYLADQANMPYGVYDREGKTSLLREHILKDVQFLLGSKYYRAQNDAIFQSDKSPVKAIVIACNTATAYGKEDIEDFLMKAGLDIPVIGVIDAGVRGALDVLEKDEDGSVAVFATVGTVSSNGYVNTFQDLRGALGYTGDIAMFQQAGLGLASAIDGVPEYISLGAVSPQDGYKGPSDTNPDTAIDLTLLPRYDFEWDDEGMLFEGDLENPTHIQINSVSNYIAYHVVSLLEQMLATEKAEPLKTVILGCTHYPFYSKVFEEEFERLYDYQEDGDYVYRHILDEEITLVDPAVNTARELYGYLRERSLFNNADLYQSEFYISVPNVLNASIEMDAGGMLTFEYKYGRTVGEVQEYVKRVPFSRRTIAPDVVNRLAESMPEVFGMMEHFHEGNEKTAYLENSYKF